MSNQSSYVRDDTSNNWTLDNVRQTFIDYYTHKSHRYVHSSSVKPYNDPSLLFCNAGMNQFKPIFIGEEPIPFKRACNSQKCIRAGGKHNDLDDVGKDIYHHTFFEMLGNWSFNDYWKETAIDYAWDLLVNVYRLNPDKIYVTYFGGNDTIGVPEDQESKKIWERYLPKDHILPFGMKDNFWEMGDSGPCGPCTEIHYDRSVNNNTESTNSNKNSKTRNAANLVNKDDPDVLEIWNLVFIQYNRIETKDTNEYKLEKLVNRFVDTGMGLERLVSILQGKQSNYDTDVFDGLFKQLSSLNNKLPDYSGKVGDEDQNEIDTAYRIIVDHIRTVCVCLSDDIVPGHQERNNVLRQILRRAVRYGHSRLGFKQPFFWKLADTLCDSLGDFYPKLWENRETIKYIIQTEETQYAKSIKSAYRAFNRFIKDKTSVTRKDANDFWTTFGFPVETFHYECKQRNITII